MRRTNHKTIKVSLVLALGLLGLSDGVQADPVLDCQVAKVQAARSRATCLANQQGKKLTGQRFNFRVCETRFDNDIAAADTNAAQQGAACRYIDNGDATVSDLNTLLRWEKKVAGSSTSFDSQGVGNCLHCLNNDLYTWNTAVSEWLSALNGRTDRSSAQSGFAGFEDWRVPTVIELQTILLEPFPCGTSPCIDPIFGPTAESGYWSSTTLAITPGEAWYVNFDDDGFVFDADKGFVLRVRGVRGGR